MIKRIFGRILIQQDAPLQALHEKTLEIVQSNRGNYSDKQQAKQTHNKLLLLDSIVKSESLRVLARTKCEGSQ